MKILVIMDILTDILKKNIVGLKLIKIYKNIKKNHKNVIRSIIDILKLFY